MMETLQTLIECDGNAAEAADRLGINQPSMSKRLALLQLKHPQVRFAWIHRQGKTWELTSEGERMWPAVKEIVRLSRLVHSDVSSRVTDSEPVAVACGQLAAQTFVIAAMDDFRANHPETEIRLSTPRGQRRIEGVETGIYDLAIVSHREADIEERYGRHIGIDHLFDDPWMLVCGKDAPAAIRKQFDDLDRASVSLESLNMLPLVIPEEDSGVRRQLEHNMVRSGVTPALRPVVQAGGWPTIMQFVRDGWGIGLVTKSAVDATDGLKKPKPLDTSSLETPRMKLIYGILPEENTPRLSAEGESLRQSLLAICKKR
ncbi:HTH-type transcriptional regulator CysB [Stieleria varia]|uniref:HTH-type transcriptional regulator CysB n=2 Tax=Stieleria varia TaxID=2528005 RepID=A0A5C6B2P0_9BACT|nr:HTH-type transcriptional regulator CysB [Stieleria varia]